MVQREIDELKAEGFAPMQIEVIKQGYDSGIDPSPYMDPRFSWEQMMEIKEGIIADIDISMYALPDTSAENMGHIKERLIEMSGKEEIENQELIHKRLVNLLLFFGIAGAVAMTAFLLFSFKDTLALVVSNLSIELSEEEVTIEYQSPFNAADYIDSYSEGRNVRVILPDNIDTTVLGSQTAVYKVTNGIRTASRSLIVNVVDSEPPTLSFNTSKVTVKAGDMFSGKNYIDSATDNYDGDLKDSVICSTLDPDLEKQKIHYEVTDSSGNKAENTLLVLIEPLMSMKQEESNDTEEPSAPEDNQQQTKPAATPAPAASQVPAATPQPEVHYEEYDETFSYEENGGVTTCTVHHGSNGSTSQSCEWIGPWEEYD